MRNSGLIRDRASGWHPVPLLVGVLAVVAALAVPLSAPVSATETSIPITSVAGFPNGRTFNDPPVNAIDGNISTWTWTTNPNNTASPSYLAIGFDSTSVNRLRLWKSADGGGGNNSKNLTIAYTTDTGPLAGRSWTTVTDLTNGFMGTELMHATSVNSDGTVTGDVHESLAGDGWASLTFDAVNATGLRIAFSNPNPLYTFCNGITADQTCTHYRVAEFEAYGETEPQDATPPSISNTVDGTLGANGWYTSDVSLTWIVDEAESSDSLTTAGCVDQTIVTDQPDTIYSCAASSDGGSAGPVDVTIKRDATAPTVTYAGNAGTYSVADDVSITCTPSDNLSGVASSTCADVSGPAWSFGLGSHTYSASALDNAGNSGNGSTSFAVSLSADGLCALVAQFSTNPGVTQGLCAKVAAASAAGARGQTKTKANVIGAFHNQVDGQTGKAFTAAQASILDGLADNL